MDSGSLQNLDPFPMSSGHTPLPPQGIGLHLPAESQIPDHPGSVVGAPTGFRPPPPVEQQSMQSMQSLATTTRDLHAARASCQFGLREYMAMQRRLRSGNASTMDLEPRFRAHAQFVLADLERLAAQVKTLGKAAENHRWRKWIVGSIVASFIPVVRKFFRRDTDDELATSSNDTEYAFKRSQGMLARIREGVFGKGGLASVAFFVFAVLYVFSNEVTLRVARTVHKRVKKVMARIERGEVADEKDMKSLDGWRWRVLLW